MDRDVETPLKPEVARRLRAGDAVYLTGTIFTARDRAYTRVAVKGIKGLPVDIVGSTIYHCGPIVRKSGKDWQVIAAGPTTSSRMSDLMPAFMRKVRPVAIIGKGGFDTKGLRAMSRHGCVYLAMTGGTAALAADMVTSVEGCHWEDLGMAEAVWELRVKDFGPLVVAVDSAGNNLYRQVEESTRKRLKKAI